MMRDGYDLVILGAGSAGLMAASFAAQLGARVALVEKHRIGGDCTWTGCVPSKALLKAARVAHDMRTADRYGLTPASPPVDLAAVMAHVRDVVEDIYRDERPAALRDQGIDVVIGQGRFVDPHTVQVDGEGPPLTTRRALIATGAHPVIPPLPGLDGVEVHTYETLWQMTRLPRHLLVVGAGPVGCELGQAFRRLGSQVTLLASRDQVLPRESPDAVQVLGQVFADEGMAVRYGTRPLRAWQDAAGIHLELEGGDTLVGDALLMATGRRPNVQDLGLEAAGVTSTPEGIAVDDKLRTNRRHIYAAGDCTGGFQYTHYAAWQAVLAVRNALLPLATRAVIETVPRTIFTDPELAHVGLNEAQARACHSDAQVTYWSMDKVDRARSEGATRGFVKLIHRRNGALLGATIVAQHAGEMIHEWIIARKRGLKVNDIAGVIHVYPTYASASVRAAAVMGIDQLLEGVSGHIVRALVRV